MRRCTSSMFLLLLVTIVYCHSEALKHLSNNIDKAGGFESEQERSSDAPSLLQVQDKTGVFQDPKGSKQTKKKKRKTLFQVNQKVPITSMLDKGEVLQGGDEVLTSSQIKVEKYDNDPRIALDAVRSITQRWPKQGARVKVPYIVDKQVAADSSKMKALTEAITAFNEYSCIDWIPATDTRKHYVKFINSAGCWSYIGRVAHLKKHPGFQPISLGLGCGYTDIAEHEMLHALGFFHEQSRPDRDKYVKVMLENLDDKSMETNFDIQKASHIDSAGEPYDVGSIMHYGSDFFAKPGENTIVLRSNGHTYRRNEKGFSYVDLKQLNDIYQCGKVKKVMAPPKASWWCRLFIIPTGLCKKHKTCTSCREACREKTHVPYC